MRALPGNRRQGARVLSLRKINKSFGSHQVLNGLSFDVRPGEIFGFVGANGAGKTTAMRIILNLLSKDSGEVLWDGEEITFTRRQKIGYMPEERGLYPKMKAREQLIYFARLHGFSTTQAAKNAEKWARTLGVYERLDDPVQKLSLGNQQRVQLAAALVHEPKLLILDEPFSGLDPVAVTAMSEVLRLMADAGAPVMFSSHQLDLVERLCDSVGIMAQGRLLAHGSISELRGNAPAPLAVAVAAPPETVQSTLATLGITAQPDPLEGTGDAPARPGLTRVIFNLPANVSDQAVLRALTQIGTLHEFGPRRPHLTELFKDAIEQETPAPESEAA
ncbi:ABC transporter ATP-binding protein [Actinobaculum suis]|uniref:ABC transporter ATP-binding protein n=1 Tax=Actinobaculum suis TaxID=1657 RepID=UPI00066FC88F|nr:ABC transporter ATP-binding protein [Actinobaculum suis]OCA93111.1 ABC transporter ATP-binding protein [Actinobaculum suis]OCA93247.1 ABC transporter ATP-binding protein [Actinobaculum suis]